ncbi:3-phosphoserine/phosphohydroxythreonine transaminase [Alicyclobacillus tolerans]|uniref:Phosphoserine aminotransferase n=1 Tax=Alicyclobacillus tolerans TaxID=90970 RepID=A0ABT9LVN7_9BACL|nr:3-phosphoserine/phosphohydroxythreonine transaminase [Alicyclobacillus tengchongensis]MDP9728326.1 phosphoserine aminotransferase [Alicyclobacillus tengchongensis]
MKRVDNFGAGPGALPTAVLEKARDELLSYQNKGISVLEMSHRSEMFDEIHLSAKNRLRRLMNIPEEYEILFLQGGASLQFSMIPMNFLQKGQTAAYVLTGSWSEKALAEAKKLGETRIAASSKEDGYRSIPAMNAIYSESNDAYLHITTNNTIYGTQWHVLPSHLDSPLVADVSSDILSRPLDVQSFSLLYAGAQKNLGPSGLTVVIVKKSWAEQASETVPTMLSYQTHLQHDSRYNTPPTFAVYLLNLVLEWTEAQGGVPAMMEKSLRKSGYLYRVIDEFPDVYEGHACQEARSRMNVTFRLVNPERTKQFLTVANDYSFIGLSGHRSVGGIRASLYNAVSEESAARLAEFMRDFAQSEK